MKLNKIGRVALFAPGEIICSSACRAAMKKGGTTGLTLLCRHITGQWGSSDAQQQAVNEATVNGGSEQEIVSRYALSTGLEIVVITSYAHTPSLRWTEICLPDEVIPESDYRPQNGHVITEDDDVEL